MEILRAVRWQKGTIDGLYNDTIGTALHRFSATVTRANYRDGKANKETESNSKCGMECKERAKSFAWATEVHYNSHRRGMLMFTAATLATSRAEVCGWQVFWSPLRPGPVPANDDLAARKRTQRYSWHSTWVLEGDSNNYS